jgi:hypothetical protein
MKHESSWRLVASFRATNRRLTRPSVATEFTETELTAAMHRLIKMGAIRSVEEGPPTRRRSFLEIAELPGLDGDSSNVVNLRPAE